MKQFLIMIGALAFSMTGFAGHEVGNGGGAWVCQDQQGKIQWIQLVDFFEAENEFNLTLRAAPASMGYEDIIKEKLQQFGRVAPETAKSLAAYAQDVKSKLQFVNAELRVIDDALFRIMPMESTCAGGKIAYTQLANYTDYNVILIRKDLWNSSQMSEYTKAGLILHEAIYAMARNELNNENSVKARRVIGLMFSDVEPFQMFTQINQLMNFEIKGGLSLKKVANFSFLNSQPMKIIFNQNESLMAVYYSGLGDSAGMLSFAVKHLNLYDAKTNKILWSTRLGEWASFQVAFSPDGQSIFVVNGAREIAQLDLKTGQQIKSFQVSNIASGQTIMDFVISSDAKTIFVWSWDFTRFPITKNAYGLITMVDVETGKIKQTLKLDYIDVFYLSLDGKTIVVASQGGKIYMLDAQSGEIRKEIQTDVAEFAAVVLLPDNNQLIYVDGKNPFGTCRQNQAHRLVGYDIEKGKEIFSRGVPTCINDLSVDSGGQVVAYQPDYERDRERTSAIYAVDVTTGEFKAKYPLKTPQFDAWSYQGATEKYFVLMPLCGVSSCGFGLFEKPLETKE